MPALPMAVTSWLAAHHTVVTHAVLHSNQLSDDAIATLLTNNILVRVGRGVYRLAGAPVTAESRAVALSARHQRGYITGVAAARMLGVRGMPRDLRMELCVPAGSRVEVEPGVILRQSTVIVPGLDHVDRSDGIRLATPSRLAFDLSARLAPDRLADSIEFILDSGWTTEDRLGSTARRLCRRGRKGSTRFAAVLLERVPGGPLESGDEVRLTRALAARGVPIEAQLRLLDAPGGAPIRVDLAVPALRWGIEVDLHSSHLRLSGTAADKQRDRRCQAIDWQISRVTKLDFLAFEELVDELVALYHSRRTALTMRTSGQATA